MAKSAAAIAACAAYCRKCFYDLRGQETPRCPECGRDFDPANPKTFRRKPRSSAGRWIKRLTIAMGTILLLVSAPYAWLYYEWRREQPAVERMTELGATLTYTRIQPPFFARLIPQRWAWMLDRLDTVKRRPMTVELTTADAKLLARCPRLQVLWVHAVMDDQSIEVISQLPELRKLSVLGDGISDASAAHLARCRHLQTLWLNRSSVTDNGLAQLCRLPELNDFTIVSPAITDAGLPALATPPKLQCLNVGSPGISDDGLLALSQLSRLRSLFVTSDRCSWKGEQSLRRALPKCRVSVLSASGGPRRSAATAPGQRPPQPQPRPAQ